MEFKRGHYKFWINIGDVYGKYGVLYISYRDNIFNWIYLTRAYSEDEFIAWCEEWLEYNG